MQSCRVAEFSDDWRNNDDAESHTNIAKCASPCEARVKFTCTFLSFHMAKAL